MTVGSNQKIPMILKNFTGALCLVLAVGCAGVHRGRSVEPSGFLKNYEQLQPGDGDQALLTYTNAKIDFRRYQAVLIEPIRIVAGEDSKLSKLSPEDRQKLVDYFDASLRQHLGAELKIVKDPAPGVLQLRVALTEARGANVAIDTLSSIMPPAIALNALKTIATGRGSGVGEASVECEVLDSKTGERVAAAVDKRVGNKYTGTFNKFNKWRATQAACDYWAERITTRLNELQGDPPK